MTNEGLTSYWNSYFSGVLPISYELKNEFNERWFRIHILPESKRYAENEIEYREILKRHNLILSDLFEANQPFTLITTYYSSNRKDILKDNKLKKMGLQTRYWMSIDVSDEIDEQTYFWHLFYDELTWFQDSLNDLLRLVAYDEIRNVMFFSTERNIVYHPYDGGADIIFESSKLRDFYKEKYKDWLSK